MSGDISIHALLAESDALGVHDRGCYRHFYPRSPCGERRARSRRPPSSKTISIHALLAESDRNTYGVRRFPMAISIHALLAESDIRFAGATSAPYKFLSTLSLRRATTVAGSCRNGVIDFYPRSPCGERPLLYAMGYYRHGDFYPRSPCGERPQKGRASVSQRKFLSTLSLRRATVCILPLLRLLLKFLSTLSLRRATACRSADTGSP